jgi:hypothetical protein
MAFRKNIQRMRYRPKSMSKHRTLLAWLTAAWLCACDGGSEQSAVPSASGPPPAMPMPSPGRAISGPHTIEGLVFDPYTGPVADAAINVWVDQSQFGYSYWWANGPLRSDQQGRFRAPNLPDSRITIWAFKSGFVQQCAVTADIGTDLTFNVEVTSVSTLNSLTPPRPQSAHGAQLTGLIFETAAAARQPVADAEIWAEHMLDVTLATTRSDLKGGFFLCNLPANTYLTVTKPGYSRADVGPFDPSLPTPVEIELKRL